MTQLHPGYSNKTSRDHQLGNAKGWFVSFEGIDGSGKTTQLELLAPWLKDQGWRVHMTREPGGTEIGRRIRSVLLDPELTQWTSEAELLLYLADRIQHLNQVILPQKNSGAIVLCDRFHDATVAYQGGGRGIDLQFLKGLIDQQITRFQPDLTLWLRVDPNLAQQRIRQRKEQIDNSSESRIDDEKLSFFEKVDQAYFSIAQKEPQRVITLDANQEIDSLQDEVRRVVEYHLFAPLSKH